jgi:hypothetical protein
MVDFYLWHILMATDRKVPTSLRWCIEAKRNAQRYGILYFIVKEIIKELSPDRSAYWTEKLRGVDTRRAALYDGKSKGKQIYNVTSSNESQNFQPPEKGSPI